MIEDEMIDSADSISSVVNVIFMFLFLILLFPE